MGEAAGLEALLRRDRLIAAACLAALCALAWLYLLSGAGMGASAWEMTRLTLLPHQPPAPAMAGMEMGGAPLREGAAAGWAIGAAMWLTMMVAMMAPAAAPAILLYARVHRHAAARDGGRGLAPTGAFAGGYLLVWAGFSALAAALQWELERGGLLAAESLGLRSRWLSAGVLIAAGLYQLTPLQRACLDHCRSPAAFLSRHWRPGAAGAIRLGARHGVYCFGCCWLLMGLLFVGGVMNLVWIAALGLLVLAQKALPGGPWIGRAAGLALIAWGLAILAA